MAPEIISRSPYQSSVDIWSCGIIQYILLNQGKHPFYEHSDTVNTFIERIQRNEVNFSRMDKFAINFFQKCANLSQKGRMAAGQALQHPWITGEGELGPMTFSDLQELF